MKLTAHLSVVGGMATSESKIKELFYSNWKESLLMIRTKSIGDGKRSVVISADSLSAAVAFKQRTWTYDGKTLQLEFQDCPKPDTWKKCSGSTQTGTPQLEPQVENVNQVKKMPSPVLKVIISASGLNDIRI